MTQSVWIIDDEKELADSVAKYFGMFGVPVHAAYTAMAVNNISDSVKVVLLDINYTRKVAFGKNFIDFRPQ